MCVLYPPHNAREDPLKILSRETANDKYSSSRRRGKRSIKWTDKIDVVEEA